MVAPCLSEDVRPIINRYGERGVSNLYSAHTLGIGRVAFGLSGDGSLDQSFLKNFERYNRDDSTFWQDSVKPAISTFNLYPFFGAGVADFLDISLMMPFYLDLVGNKQEPGFGDLRISVKVGTAPASRMPVFDLSFLTALIVPTGAAERGLFPRHLYYFDRNLLAADTPQANTDAFYSGRSTDIETRVLATLDLANLKQALPLALHLDCGMHFSTAAGNDHALLLNGAIESHFLRWLAFVTELRSEMRLSTVSHGFKLNYDPLEIAPAFVVTPSSGFSMTIGAAFSLASPTSRITYCKGNRYDAGRLRLATGIEPRWRLFAQIGWSGIVIDIDRDHDGVFDAHDQCPAVPEDVDGFQDDDGCPDADNDNDRIPDSLDKCPKEPEDRDGFQDDDGCPDADNDNDRVPDTIDKCPNLAEDFDGFQDKDGCPDSDNDNDGVPDNIDKCPTVSEDVDGFQDDDGCPDVDNDQDGVPDSLDKCLNEPGPASNGGCPAPPAPAKPKAKEIKRGRVILRGVSFEQGTATIDPSSYFVLDEVVSSLVDWPEVRIEIQGHTDNSGKKEKRDEIAQGRADAVRQYLIARGIEPGRMTAVGKGDGDPIADNRTAAGRVVNNRIELRRIDQ